MNQNNSGSRPAGQGCLLSPILINTFLERIMSDALEEHDGKVSIGDKILPICSLPMTEML